MKNRQSSLSDNTAAKDQDFHTRSSAKTADEFTFSAIDGQHGLKTEQSTLLTSCLAVRRTITMGVLCGKCDDFLIKKCLYLFRMCCRMDAGKYNLTFSEQIKLRRFKFFYFSYKFTGTVNLFSGIYQYSSGLCISLIFKSCFFSGSFLYFDCISITNQSCYLSRCGNNSVFTFFDIL